MAFPQAVRPTTAKTGKSSGLGKNGKIGRKVVGASGRHGQVNSKIIKAVPVAIKEVQALESTVLDLQVAALGLQVFPQRTPMVQWRMRMKKVSPKTIRCICVHLQLA